MQGFKLHFILQHPGGPDILLEHAGRDCTVPFQDKGHTTHAVTLLSKYKIGMLREVSASYVLKKYMSCFALFIPKL